MDPELQSYIVNFLQSMELNNKSPYSAQFSTGRSGLSFGVMQNDVANNSAVYTKFQNILTTTAGITGLTSDQISSIMKTASQKGGVNAAAFGDLLPQINQALSSPAGQALVNAQDQAQEQVVFNMVQGALNAACFVQYLGL